VTLMMEFATAITAAARWKHHHLDEARLFNPLGETRMRGRCDAGSWP
jgi:hypothetical protein